MAPKKDMCVRQKFFLKKQKKQLFPWNTFTLQYFDLLYKKELVSCAELDSVDYLPMK